MTWELDGFRLRSLQEEFQKTCHGIYIGDPFNRILVVATPGGGKSSLPVIAAAELIKPRWADRLCWVASRESLLDQAQMDFLDPRLRNFLRHDCAIRRSTNDIDPSRGMAGYATTYHALGVDTAKINQKEFERHRYILVLDEFHHLALNGVWHQAVRPLIERCRLLILMTGSLYRGNKEEPIGEMPYKQGKIGLTPDLESNETRKVIRYTRQDALRERAIIPLIFQHADASAEWVNRLGEERTIATFEAAARDCREALFVALRTDFALSLLDKTVRHWQAHKLINRRAKLLVVAATQNLAKKYYQYLKERGLKAKIAVSDDSPEAAAAIKAFRKGSSEAGVDILITVAMAYEGLNVPAITHIACLTAYRTEQWIDQMLNRATRYDREAGAWEGQFAFVFLPDDYEMQQIVDAIRAEQEAVVGDVESLLKTRNPAGEVGETPPTDSGILPLASEVSRERCSDFATGEHLGYEETRQIQVEMECQGIFGTSALQIKRLMTNLGFVGPLNGSTVPSVQEPLLTPSEREANLRKTIQKHCSATDVRRGWDHGETNRLVLKRFNKPRDQMTVDELRRVWEWIQGQFPVELKES